MNIDPFENSIPSFDQYDDRALVDIAKFLILLNSTSSTDTEQLSLLMNPTPLQIDAYNDHFKQSVITELKNRILTATKEFVLPESSVFKNFEMTLENLIDYLLIMISDDKEEFYNAMTKVTGMSFHLLTISELEESDDKLSNKQKYIDQRQLIDKQNVILLHQLLIHNHNNKLNISHIVHVLLLKNSVHNKSIFFVSLVEECILRFDSKIKKCLTVDGKRNIDINAIKIIPYYRAVKESFVELKKEYNKLILQRLFCRSGEIELAAFDTLVKMMPDSITLLDLLRLLNKLPPNEPCKLDALSKLPQINGILDEYNNYCIVNFTFEDLKCLTAKDIESPNLELFDRYDFISKISFMQSKTKLTDLRALIDIFDDAEFYMFIVNYNKHIDQYQDVFNRYIDPQFVKSLNQLKELSYHIDLVDKDDEFFDVWQIEPEFCTVNNIYELYLRDSTTINSIIKLIKLLTKDPVVPNRKDNGPLNFPRFRVALYYVSCLPKYAVTLQYIKLIDLFDNRFLKQLFIVLLEKIDGFADKLGKPEECVERFALIANFFNKLSDDVIDWLLHQNYKDLLDISRRQSKWKEDYYPEYTDFFNNTWLNFYKILNLPDFINELNAIDADIVGKFILQFKLDQLIELSEIKSPDRALQGMSLLTALSNPNMIKWAIFNSFEKIKEQATAIFAEFSNLMHQNSQPRRGDSMQLSVSAVNSQGVFAKRSQSNDNIANDLSSLPTRAMLAELKRRKLDEDEMKDMKDILMSNSQKPIYNLF